MISRYDVRVRLAVVLLSLVSLATAILNSVDALLAGILRDHSRGNQATADNGSQEIRFLALQRFMLYIAGISAVGATLFGVFSFVTAINPTRVGKYSTFQTMYGVILVAVGGYAAQRVRGCEAEFERLSSRGSMPYYNVIYYGYITQAVYGFVLIVLSLVFAAISPVVEDSKL
ncbi:hypothetical protein F5883DRAFT_430875 [Diaporthe sp. PMI_573]|nr:hypothetical protein F5883DRAFT_430875 [Diaporthaceae sp. PMI_573]